MHVASAPESWNRRFLLVTAASSAALAILLYSGSMRAAFVADDWDFLTLVDRAGSAGIAFEPLVERFFRPWVVLLYYVNYKAFGLWPLPFHLTVVLLHALNAWLLCLLTIRITKGNRVLGVLTGALFLAFAGHTEAVSWIAGVADTILMPFAIGGLLLLDRALTSSRPLVPIVVGWIVLAAGIMSKETSVMLPVLAAAFGAAYAMSVTGDERRRALARTVGFVVVPVLIVLGYLVMRRVLFGDATGAYAGLSLSWGTFLLYTRAFVLRIFFPPWGRLAIAWSHGHDLWLLGAGLVVLAMAWRSSRYRVPLLFAVAAAGIMLAPALPLTISLSTTETERSVYIPTAFGALLLVLTIDALLPRPSVRNVVAGLLIAAHGVVLQRFTNNWREAGDVFAELIESFAIAARANDPGPGGHFFILNLPDNLRGAYIFRRGFYIALALHAPDLGSRQGFITGISSHTLFDRNDPVAAAQDAPGSFSLDVTPNIFLQTAPPVTPFYEFREWTPRGFRLQFTPVVRNGVVFAMTGGRIEFRGSIDGGGSPFGALELPQDDAVCDGSLRFSGWALDDTGVAEVAVGIAGGEKLGCGTVIPNQRGDVAAVYSGYPHLERAGWEFFLPCTRLTGSAQIEVTAVDGDGNATLLGSRAVRRAGDR